ncbi:MAG: hypothetical protein FJ030_16220 [Chloroflexi bacterium]|nr:hypothetical protein [Chloroflexota bacterium]
MKTSGKRKQAGINFVMGTAVLLLAVWGAPTASPARAEAEPAGQPAAAAAPVLKRVIVLRVYFDDYANASRYTQAQVQAFFDDNLNTLWQNTSYGHIGISAQVTDLFEMPENRSAYIDDGDGWTDVNGNGSYQAAVDNSDGDGDGVEGTPCDVTSGGDLSCGDKYDNVLLDAVAASPDTLNWDDIDAVMVVMAETSNAQFHRGQANTCNLPMGPDGDEKLVGCAIFSENPTETDLQVWGRWAHEVGHAFQQGGPAHPSNYRNSFELMDALYPGQTGVFEKQSHTGFPGWLPSSKYQTFTSSCDVGPAPCVGLGGGAAFIWAQEYDPTGKPNVQAVKAYITDNLYYLISVRRRVLGDELVPIPDEGVLIERVVEDAPQWVTVQGKGGDRNKLWKAGDSFNSVDDGITIAIRNKVDDDNYGVYVTYDRNASLQPDVMLNPWVSPPGESYETTDIWIDSPVNGYGVFRYGMWDDGTGNQVPRGNGDDPAVGLVNRLYARVRNVGGAPASNVVVNFEITDPPGLGIAGSNGFTPMGTVDKIKFPALANIDPGQFVDVYYEWTPDFAVSPQDMAAGKFKFHTCVRVILDAVADETVLGNQDGDREQENIGYFETPPAAGAPAFNAIIHLRNDDAANPKFFQLYYQSDLPAGWAVNVNNGDLGVDLAPNQVVDIPVKIIPGGGQAVGGIYGVDIAAASWLTLVSDLDPKDTHLEFDTLGGVLVETRIVQRTKVTCTAKLQTKGMVKVDGLLSNFAKYYDPANPLRVLAVGVDAAGKLMPGVTSLLNVDSKTGSFSGALADRASKAKQVVCLFAGTVKLGSAASGYVKIK